jgi:hypothetical protein
MSKKSLQKKVALLNDYITKEIEKEMITEIDEIEKNTTAKIEKKYIRQNYPYHSRSHYVT